MFTWAVVIAAAALAFLAAVCSPGSDDLEGIETLTVYVSLPLSGPDGRDTPDGWSPQPAAS